MEIETNFIKSQLLTNKLHKHMISFLSILTISNLMNKGSSPRFNIFKNTISKFCETHMPLIFNLILFFLKKTIFIYLFYFY
jgi:hypothetical protein